MNVIKVFRNLLSKLQAIHKKALGTDIHITIEVIKYDYKSQAIFVTINHVHKADYINFYFGEWRLQYEPDDDSSMLSEFTRLTNKLKEWNLLK